MKLGGLMARVVMDGRGTEVLSSDWSLNNITKCGIVAFNRNCQKMAGAQSTDVYPFAAACVSPNEAIFIVEDDASTRAELEELLGSIGVPIHSFPSTEDFFRFDGPIVSGVLIVDIQLPGLNGVALHDQVRARFPDVSVVYVSGELDVETVRECFVKGAYDIIEKPFRSLRLREVVMSALGASRVNFCRSSSKSFVTSLFDQLTPTEQKVARLAAIGHHTKSIAALFERSENTVKIHKSNIFNKLKLKSVASVSNILSHMEDISKR